MDTTLRDPLIGTLLDGRYRVEQRIATGGMATVYRGTDTRLDRVVALKVMHPSLAGDAEFSARFIREAKAVARLSHPNVVGVFDQGADAGAVFLAMEYVPGHTLREVLLDRGALSIRAALDILEPVLAALGAAHRAGLVHRDVKPENVLITEGGLVKVADFGLVRVLAGSDTAVTNTTSRILGTVSYLAPEQIEPSSATDQRVDVYAAGILLYEMLTGHKPHTGENPMQVLYRHLHEDVPAPSLIAPGIPPTLDAIVAAATARDPQARPYDAVELLAALQRVRRELTPAQLDAEPPSSSRPSPQFPTGEQTTVLPPTVLPPAVERTSVLEVPPSLVLGRPYDEPQPAPKRRKRRSGPRRSHRPLIWGAVLAVLALLVVGISYRLSGAVYATVPVLAGDTQAQAVGALDAVGLHGRFTQAYSETVASGQVIASNPGAGKRARKSDPVQVTLSKGPDRIAVPDVTGKPLDQANQQLTGAGLAPGATSQDFSDSVPTGSVISSSPQAGQVVPPNTPVALVISKGKAPIPVKDVTGMTLDQAQNALTGAGFQVQLAPQQVYSDTAAAGTVAAQSPQGQAAPGSTITLTVSRGPQLFPVPNVSGMTEQDATKTLTDAGFKVDAFTLNPLGTAHVTSQNPGPNEQKPKGTTITIWLF